MAMSTPERLRRLQMMQRSLMTGVAVVTAFVVAFSARAAKSPKIPNPSDLQLLYVLSGLNLFALLLNPILARVVLASSLRQGSDAAAPGADEAAGRALFERLCNLVLIRWLLSEAPAMLGATACLVAVLNGVLPAYPLFWINLVSPLYFIGNMLRTPAEEALLDVCSQVPDA